jgi:hypothetical protein
LDDLGEAFAATMLLEVPPGGYYVVGFREESTGDYVDYAEEEDEQTAQAVAAVWRQQGRQVAIWRRVE